MLAPPLYWFGKIMNPFIWLMNGSARLFLRLFKVEPAGHEEAHSEEELKLIMAESYKSGEINQTELTYLKNIFEFDERIVKNIMIPRDELITIDQNLSRSEFFAVLDQHEYTRYPVTEDGNKDRILGFINTKELLTGMAAGRTPVLESLLHKMPRFTENTPIQEVLAKMQQSRTHMAVVTSKDGRTAGLVTMEDILEEIVGEISEESLEADPI
jgi:CBS domain containing-hemolysin-like protein